jgi:hypothetical protein
MDVEDRLELIKLIVDDHPWQAVIIVGRVLLDHYYPANIFTGSSGDPGPAYVVAMRQLLAQFKENEDLKRFERGCG